MHVRTQLKQIAEIASTLVVALAAVAMTYAYFQDRRAVAVTRDPAPAEAYELARVIPDWQKEIEFGIRKGPSDAAVIITEFIDLECHYCAQLAPVIDSLALEFPQNIAVVFHHFPLAQHEHAVAAAIAAECADRQNRFWQMVEVALSGQRRFGVTPWESFAEEAGVVDLEEFSLCIAQPPESFPRIEHGRSLGERTGVTGTPSIWINGRVIRPTREAVHNALYSSGGI